MITQRIPAEKDKNRHERIKTALHKQRKTFQGVADDLGKTVAYVRNVSAGYFFVPGIAYILARQADIPLAELWPDEVAAGAFDRFLQPIAQQHACKCPRG